MSETNRTSKARVKHQCRVCDSPINPGDEQVSYSGIAPGEGRFRVHLHPECDRFAAKWDAGDWECNGPGDVSREEVLEALNHPTP